MIKSVVFDMDGTLVDEVSWTYLTRMLGASVQEHIDLYARSKSDPSCTQEILKDLTALWRATGNASRANISKIMASMPLRPEAKEVVSALGATYRTTIITGSIDLCAAIVADRLDISEYFANATFLWDEHDLICGIRYEPNQSGKKLEHLSQFLDRHALMADECVVVGDGNNDLGLFKATGKGILLESQWSNTEKVRPVAWKTISNLSELTGIL